MTPLLELIQAAEQAARDEIIEAISRNYYPSEARAVPDTRGALERVIKAAVAKQKEAQRRAAQAAIAATTDAFIDYINESETIIKELLNATSHTGTHVEICKHCVAVVKAKKFLEGK